MDGEFAALPARELLTKEPEELRRSVTDRRAERGERERVGREDRGAGGAADRAGAGAGGPGGGAAAGLAAAREPDGAPQEIPSSQARALRVY